MTKQEVKFIVRGRLVSPEGKDLGAAPKAGEVAEEAEGQEEEEGADTRKVEELRSVLEAAQVEIPSGAKKADLQKLAQQHGV